MAAPKSRPWKKKINDLHNMLDIQASNCMDSYMVGLYNGIEISLAVLEDRNPNFRNDHGELAVLCGQCKKAVHRLTD